MKAGRRLVGEEIRKLMKARRRLVGEEIRKLMKARRRLVGEEMSFNSQVYESREETRRGRKVIK